MKISDRSYSQSRNLPKVQVHVDESSDVAFIYINWGEQAHAENLIAEMKQFIHAASADVEVTHPFEWFAHLPQDVNILRIATLMGNDYLYRQENNHELQAGIELLVMKKNQNMISWARVGRPTLFQLHKNQLVPLQNLHSPIGELPNDFLGLHLHPEVQSGHFAVNENKHLLVYCGVDWPQLDALDLVRIDVDEILKQLIHQQPKIAGFWLGTVEF